MKLQRTSIIVGIITLVILATAGYGIWYSSQDGDAYPGLNQTYEVQMTDETRQHLMQRMALKQAAIRAVEASGEEPGDYPLHDVAYDAYALGDLVTAREYTERRLALYGLDSAGHNEYANILERMADYDKAREEYKLALMQGERAEDFYRDYLTLLENRYPGTEEERKAVLESAVVLFGQNSWNMTELGDWYEAAHDCEQAIAHYAVAKTLAPANKAIVEKWNLLKRTCE